MTNKELYDLTKYLFESWERGADYDKYHMDSQYVLDALVMPEEERWLLYTTPPVAQPKHPLPAIRALTEQCAALVWERDELKKQIQQYEKSGVTCQTYRHKVGRSCAECNVHETYTTPPKEKNT